MQVWLPKTSTTLAKWEAYAARLATASAPSVAVSVGSLAILLLWPKVSRRIPAPIVAILAASVAVAMLGLPIETIGSRFGETRFDPGAEPARHHARARARALSPAVTVTIDEALEVARREIGGE